MTKDTNIANWIAADATEHSLRIWTMNAAGDQISKSDQALTGTTPEAAVASLLCNQEIPQVPVFLCGLTSLPPLTIPAGAFSSDHVHNPESDGSRRPIHTLRPLLQKKPAVLLSRKAVVANGFVNAHPNYDGILLIIDHDSHWVQISADEIVHANGFCSLTIFKALFDSQPPSPGDAFLIEAQNTLSRPERFAARLSSLSTLENLSPPDAHVNDLALGVLIGVELAGARPFWLGQRVDIIAANGFGACYQAALADCGVTAGLHDFDSLLLSGLKAARDTIMTG